MLLKAAINGARLPGEHPALPLQPAELAAAASAAMDAGAGAVHFHVRARDGRESLAAEDVEAAVATMRSVCGRVPLGVSTGAWILPDAGARLAAVASWRLMPDFASVNFHEPGAAELARALLQRNVGVEAGLTTARAARRLIESGLGAACLRILLEPQEHEVSDAVRSVEAIEAALSGAPIHRPRLLHGAGPTAWPLLDVARRRGYDARIGLEDTLELPDGRLARDNAQMVAVALTEWRGQPGRADAGLLPER
jgi:uncharacterized protein (DUF849 family)